MRTIKQLHRAVSANIHDLVTYRAIPTASVDYIDPFLFLNHHGPQVYPPHNQGLPFGPHPHRGMETVTFILEGDIAHYDSGGHESVIGAGGVQWMTAGRGLIHAEVSSGQFREKGGPLEILQLWVNLPAKRKMTEPWYSGKQSDEIPVLNLSEGRVKLQLVCGRMDLSGEESTPPEAAFHPGSELSLAMVFFDAGGKLLLEVPSSNNVFFYVVRGSVIVNGVEVPVRHLAEFNFDGTGLEIETDMESVLLLGHAQPLHEPVVSRGPFVMNTDEEIRQAYIDYQAGEFGEEPLI